MQKTFKSFETSSDETIIPEYISPRNPFERSKILESLTLLTRIQEPVRYIFVVPMYKEDRRLNPFSNDNLLGEDALRRKIMQMILLSKVNPNIKGRIIAVDDGSPQASSAQCVRFLWDKIRQEYLSRQEPLDEEMVSVLVINEEEKARLKSKKGAAILLGLRHAYKEGWATHIGYTDVDTSTNLLQTPLLLKPLIEDGAGVAIGSYWISGADSHGVSLKRIISSKLFNLIVHVFLPPLWGIRDTQRAFKLFDRTLLGKTLNDAAEPGFTIDTELLVLTKLAGKSIKEVPIAWVDSSKASTINFCADSLGMFLSILKQSRHLFRTRVGSR